MAIENKKRKERLATFDLKDHNMEVLEDVGVDDIVTLQITAKMVRKQEGEYPSFGCGDDDCEICYPSDGGDGKKTKKISATFEIQKIENKGVKGQKQYSSAEAKVASKYNALIKQGLNPTVAMQRAMKG
jgi:hypothetical protein